MLIMETSENKRILKELEDRLLLELATQTGSILDNWDLIGTLEDIKNKAVEIGKQLAQAAIVSKDVERQRDSFRSAARRGAILFFILSDLSLVCPMYQFSLSAYLTVFVKALKKAMPNSSLTKRLTNIKNSLTYVIYCYGCMGIFEQHKLLLSFQLAIRLQQDEKLIKPKELAFFIRGNTSLMETVHYTPPFNWISQHIWLDLVYLAAFLPKHFGKLIKDICNMGNVWKKWYESNNPESITFPGRYANLHPFLKLCLIRCWRMDRIPSAITNYVIQPGSDPQSQLTQLSHSLEFSSSRIKYLSMGQGQEPHAQSLFVQCAARGNWLLLQNCHLLVGFIPTLEKMIDDLNKPHPDFRICLTTEMVSDFPIGILRRSYKVVMESPIGLKQNLVSGLGKLSHKEFVSCEHPNYRACLYTLVFLHSVLQERRRYGKLGWNVSYDFSDTDFFVSLRILQLSLTKSLEEKTNISWDTIKYLIGEVIYGGRIIDNFDRRVLTTYMDEYFSDFLFDDIQPFTFYERSKLKYVIPEEPADSTNYKELYLEYVSHLPGSQKPEVLGFHSNASIGYTAQYTHGLWSNLLLLMPETESIGGVPSAKHLSIVASLSGSESHSEIRGSATSAGNLIQVVTNVNVDDSEHADIQSASDENATALDPVSEVNREVGTASSSGNSSEEEDDIEEFHQSNRRRNTSISVSTGHSSMTSVTDASIPTTPTVSSGDVMVSHMVDGILNRLPHLFDVDTLKRKYMGTEISPTINVLIQELNRFNLILEKINTSLSELKNALSGKVGMSSELDNITHCLINGILPDSWRRLVPQTEKSLPNWLQHLMRRADQYKKWINAGKSEPAVIWLSGLHLPQSYITALILKACRKYGWAIDKCAIQTTVTDVVPEEVHTILMAPEIGCYVCGLYIEGSAWDVKEMCLTRQKSGELLQEMPIVKLTPIEKHRLKLTNTVKVPVYVTSQRCNAMGEGFVLELDIPLKNIHHFGFYKVLQYF
ncbi:unnamed protein product [Heterobilharzia americana]|nr:unnamed protein product [Heterobilharzia americana]